MALNPVAATRLEKAAVDNGFDLGRGRKRHWLAFGSSQTDLCVWLTTMGESSFLVALSRADVLGALSGMGVAITTPLPQGASGARRVSDIPALHRLVRRSFQLSRALPDAPLQDFRRKTADLPRSTEAERLLVQRVGQNVFRDGLLDYWEGRCAITGLAVPALLRASHIKPWAHCEEDAARLDIFNGLLLAPHLDALFDQGYITVQNDGSVTVSDVLEPEARELLGLNVPLLVPGLANGHRTYLPWHRERIFKG